MYSSLWLLFLGRPSINMDNMCSDNLEKLQIFQRSRHCCPTGHSTYFERKIIYGKNLFFEHFYSLYSIKI